MIKRRFRALSISAAIGAAAVVSLSVSDHNANASSVQSSAHSIPERAVTFPTIIVMHKSAEETQQEIRCLALNIYWEARSEPLAGQVAVAAVTLNRVEDRRFPDEICNVVRQGGEIRRHRCQFSWWCDGKKDDPLEAEAWRRANTLARLTAAGVIEDPTGGAMWYHADYVDPYWADAKKQVTKIGRHIFYTLPKRAPTQVSAKLQNN
jgi:spore germination cell wall hydrolase CwlJ-like protein